jgi:hypothetical protein
MKLPVLDLLCTPRAGAIIRAIQVRSELLMFLEPVGPKEQSAAVLDVQGARCASIINGMFIRNLTIWPRCGVGARP